MRGPLLGFACRFLVVYALVAGPWSLLPTTYEVVYRATMNRLLQQLPLDHAMRLEPCRSPDPSVATCAVRLDGPAKGRLRVHRGGMHAFLATGFLAALLLATPNSIAGRVVGLFAGMALLGCYLVVRLACHFLLTHASGVLPAGSAARGALDAVAYARWYIAPVVIWALLSWPAMRTQLRPGRLRSTAVTSQALASSVVPPVVTPIGGNRLDGYLNS